MTEQEMEELLEIDRELKSHFALRPHMGESYTRIKAEARQEIIQNLITDGVLTHEQLNECLMEKIMFGDYRGDEEMWKIPHCGLLARPEPLERPEPLNGVAKATKEALEYAGAIKFKTMEDIKREVRQAKEEQVRTDRKAIARKIKETEDMIVRDMADNKTETVVDNCKVIWMEGICEHFREVGFTANVFTYTSNDRKGIRIELPTV